MLESARKVCAAKAAKNCVDCAGNTLVRDTETERHTSQPPDSDGIRSADACYL